MAFHFSFGAIGTSWKIDSPDHIEKDAETKLLEAIRARIDIFDKDYSRFRKDSLVTEISQKAGEYTLPDDALPMMSLYKEMYDVTGGLVTPLVGQVISDAGYDASYSLKPKKEIAKAPKWEDALEYAHPILKVKEPALLDFGALGKGYLIDIVSEILRDHGIQNYTVDAGGDIAYKNAKKELLKIGLENPEDFKQAVGVAEIHNQSICGSSGNRRAWDKYHHIINPKTVESPRHILALWTVAKTTLLADALSTALFFIEPEKLLGSYSFEYAILYADHSGKTSPGFPAISFKNDIINL